MPCSDLREFLLELGEQGELRRIGEQVDWDLEAGAIARYCSEMGLPAPLFENVKDYPAGYRLLAEVLGNHRRVAIAMGMKPDTGPKELILEYIRRKKSPLKPVRVNDGSCKENVLVGDEVDLYKFPVPMIHPGDGDRFVGTWHLTICKDPEMGWVNWGTYRHMLQGKNMIGLQAGPPTHVMRIRQKWTDRNMPMEIAVVIGAEPISHLCAPAPVPYGIPEADVVGGIRGEPLQLVKCETVDLEVPATAEIVIEGEVRLGDGMEEGPFGEYTGFMGGHREVRPVIDVKAVTHRDDPIFTMANEGMPVSCTHATQSITRSAELWELLESQGIPVAGVYEFTETCTLMVVVSIRAGLARADDVAHAVWASRLGVSTPWVVVVEDDVDPFDMGEVLQALVSKCHPYRGVNKLEHERGLALFPFLTRHEQKYLMGARTYFDCTWPADWDSSELPPEVSFDRMYPDKVREKVLEIWHRSSS